MVVLAAYLIGFELVAWIFICHQMAMFIMEKISLVKFEKIDNQLATGALKALIM